MNNGANELIKQPQGYGPKKPEIIDMAQQASDNIHIGKSVHAVKKHDGCSYIDGVPMLEWGKHRDNTYCGAIAAASEVMGINVSYETLMGVSGLCFRFGMKPDWCPSSPLAQNGRVWDENINALLGVSIYSIADDEERKTKIVEQLDRGFPIIGMGQMGAPEWDLLTGYHQDSGAFFGRSYFDSQESNPDSVYCLDKNDYYTDNKYRRAQNYPGMEPSVFVKFFDRACEKKSALELLKSSLEICLYYHDCAPIYGTYFGVTAYDIMIKGLLADSDENEHYHLGCLADSRLCASKYLNESAALLNNENSRKKLQRIATLYRDIYDSIISITPYETLTPVFNRAGNHAPWDRDIRVTLVGALRQIIKMEDEICKSVKEILQNCDE